LKLSFDKRCGSCWWDADGLSQRWAEHYYWGERGHCSEGVCL